MKHINTIPRNEITHVSEGNTITKPSKINRITKSRRTHQSNIQHKRQSNIKSRRGNMNYNRIRNSHNLPRMLPHNVPLPPTRGGHLVLANVGSSKFGLIPRHDGSMPRGESGRSPQYLMHCEFRAAGRCALYSPTGIGESSLPPNLIISSAPELVYPAGSG